MKFRGFRCVYKQPYRSLMQKLIEKIVSVKNTTLNKGCVMDSGINDPIFAMLDFSRNI